MSNPPANQDLILEEKAMKSILEKLYYGEISPCSEPTPTTERYLEAKDEVEPLPLTGSGSFDS